MSPTRHTGPLLIAGLVLSLVALPAPAQAQPRALASTGMQVSASVAKKGPVLRLTASHRTVTAGSRVTLRIANKAGVRRVVRVQRWDAGRHAWRTVATRKVAGAKRVSVAVHTGTSRYRAIAPKVRKRSHGHLRTHRAARSATIAVTGRPRPAAGALAIGKASYPVPGDARYVVPRGTSTGAGTLADPYGSLGYALSRVRAGGTLVLRGGRYHESVLVPATKTGVTIQNRPGEAVWLDGSERVTNWTQDGTRWVSSNWDHVFDHRIMSGGTDQTSRWVDASRPLASYPDQVWIDGTRLTQVGSESAVRAGTFHVDEAGRRLVIGNDPRGRTVEASTLQRAMEIHARNAVVRGIGIRRYATTNPQFATVIAGVSGIRMENVAVVDNAWIGIAAWSSGQRFRNVTVSGNGLMGLGGNKTDDLVIESSVFRGNNAQGFKPAPVASGIKITRAKKVLLRDNVVTDTPYAGGVWFDVSSSYLTIVRNSIARNAAGLMLELSENAVVADNHIYDNAGTGVRIQNTGSVDVWNNTIVGNPRPFAVWADARRQEVASLAAAIPWVVDDIEVRNNIMAMTGSNPCPILTQDESQRLSGNDFGIRSNNNVFQRPGAAAPANFACWANGVYQVKSFKNLPQFRSGTGNDRTSSLVEGRAVVDGRGAAATSTASLSRSVAAPLPASIASAIGRSGGTRYMGAFTARH